MKALFKSWIVRSVALMLAALVASSVATAQDRAPFRQEELDQMLAPIALYPDPLLSQILMASTYPLEVVEASRWSHANPGLKGQDAVRAVDPMNWDPSVKSLVAFPQVLGMMDSKLEWTESLGEAFMGQQEDVMNTVQALRRKAEAAGNLLSSDQMRVARDGDYITLAPPAPEVVYVPYYNPTVVYGPWWWPAYPPVYWAPPAYYVGPAYRPGFYWSSGITISATFFFGHTDWHRRRVTVVQRPVTNVTVNRTTIINAPARSHTAWQPDPAHRRGAPFHSAAARQRFEQRANTASPAPASRPAAPRAAVSGEQRRTEPRNNAAPERREVSRRERSEPAQPRVAPQNNRANANQGERPSTRQGARSVAPEARARSASPEQQRPERRVERREAPRPQAQTQSAAPRPAPAAPAPRAEARDNGRGARPDPAAANASRPAKGQPHERSKDDQQRGERGERGERGPRGKE